MLSLTRALGNPFLEFIFLNDDTSSPMSKQIFLNPRENYYKQNISLSINYQIFDNFAADVSTMSIRKKEKILFSFIDAVELACNKI